MTPTDADFVEHLLRLLPSDQAELVYLEAVNTSWRTAVGVHLDALKPFPDGTPLSSAVTGRRCRADWRTEAPAEPNSAWDELAFLRIATGTEGTDSPFEELDNLRLAVEAKGLAYRN